MASRLIVVNHMKTLGGRHLCSCIILWVHTRVTESRKILKKISDWNFPFISIFEHLAKKTIADVMRQFDKLEENLIKRKTGP